ncbi:DUF4097 family beta strand repeat-containing protein [Flindersiella endophytica]
MSGDTGTNPPGDAWAAATDDVAESSEQKSAYEKASEAKADEEQARADEEQARADEEQARADEEQARADEEQARTDEAKAEYTDAKEVLAAVAAGKITPDEAAELLDKLKGSEQAGAGETKAEVPVTAAKPKRVRIRAVGRRVKIVGEPFVKTIAVDGPHVVRQEGDTLLISSEGEFGASLDGFTLTPPRSLRDVQQKLMDLGRELSIRVNPGLEIEAEITAGSINAERAPLLAQVRVTAGSARVRDVEGPIDVLVQAGSAQVEGKIVNGRSRLRVESGSLQLRLLQGSSVRIRPDAQLGRVQWEPPARPGKENDEQVVGGGDARLDLEIVMGAATVKEAP